ncbi:MAG: hypothetical protein M1821_000024 [Bathelium mastoideum]|nr:MAG: hypothetical protein M1821_000024 [Bathelium mastoideum]
MADSDDEELKLAIALSLQQPESSADSHPALISPGACFKAEKLAPPPALLNNDDPLATGSRNSQTSFGKLQLDRRAMEKERLARIAARVQRHSVSPASPDLNHERPSKIRKLNSVETENRNDNTARPTSSSTCGFTYQGRYPRGIVRRTWALGHPRVDDIKIEEVLQSNTLRIAVLSAFQWDTDWLLTKMDPTKTKFILVMQAKEEAHQQQYLHATKHWPHVRLCFPPMPGQVSCMHSKLMLLFHAEFLRIAIPSANLVAYDWGETGVMENSVFLIDLPRLPENKWGKREGLTPFGEELMHFVDAMGLQDDVKNGLLRFDFDQTDHLGFVHTIGGTHQGRAMERTGFPGLSRTVTTLGLQTQELVEIDFATSSLGSLNAGFLATLYSAVQGLDGTSGAVNVGQRSKSDFFAKSCSAKTRPPDIADHFRVYFPTEETVSKSTGGRDNGGTICFQSKWYHAPTFPKGILRDYRSVREGLLSHNKIMYVRGKRQDKDGNQLPVAWAYVGSANLSESAWGKRVTDRATKQPKLNARNWECGVIVQVPHETLANSEKEKVMDVFNHTIRPPFQYPAHEYGGRKPWFFME